MDFMKKNIIFTCFILIFSLVAVISCAKSPEDLPKTPPKTDTELFFDFYNEIMNRMKAFDNKYQIFADIANKGKTMEAIAIAAEIDEGLHKLQSDINGVQMPVLKNQEALTELNKAKNFLSSGYLNKSEAISNFLEHAKHPSPYTKALMLDKLKKSKQEVFLGMGSLYIAGGTLGLKLNEISERNHSKP